MDDDYSVFDRMPLWWKVATVLIGLISLTLSILAICGSFK